MPSPFRGMDPFVEDQVWPDFHLELIADIRAVLMRRLAPNYTARIEERIYLQSEPYDTTGPIRPDVPVLREMGRETAGGGAATAMMIEPLLVPLPMPKEAKEAFLEVRLRETHEVIAVIEVLSPGTRKFDLDKKRKIYERHGVKEYWVVDPVSKESLGYQMKDSKFILFKQDKGKISSILLKHTFKF